MEGKRPTLLLIAYCALLIWAVPSFAQVKLRPQMAVGELTGDFKLDGVLDEPDWAAAPVNADFQTIVPEEGGVPSGRTQVQVLASPRFVIIGVRCYDDNPSGIVNFSKLRDVDLDNEDHVRVVIDPFLDGQSGVILAVNASAARYDALVANRGESENKDWDAIWEAKAVVDSLGWSVEIRLPIQSISFKKGLHEWGFNVERRIQRNLETIRWTNIKRDQWFTQTSRAGLLTNLPTFNYGVGLNVRPAIITNFNKEGRGRSKRPLTLQ